MPAQDPPASNKSNSDRPGQKDFPSRESKPEELGELKSLFEGDLHDEIAMLRVCIRRVMELADREESLNMAIKVLGALGTASTRLAGLLKTQKLLGGERSGDVAAAISQALSDVVKELGIK